MFLHAVNFNKLIGSYFHMDGLVQGSRNSSALVMELRLSCINQLIR